MAKKNIKLICTAECEKCIHSIISEKDNVKIHCNAKNKEYFFGQYVPCDLKETINGNKRK